MKIRKPSVAGTSAETSDTPAPAPVVLPPEDSAAFQIRRAHLAFERLLSMRLARHGVKYGYYNYLRALWIKDHVTQRDLSDATRVTETTTVALLKGMVRDGLVKKVRDSDDKRKLLVSLTAPGRALEPLLIPDAIDLNAIATQGIDPADVQTFTRIAARIAGNLEKAFGDENPG